MVVGETPPQQVGEWAAGTRMVAKHLRAPALEGRLYLLPDKTIEGMAAYLGSTAGLVKTLRRDGIDIDFALPKDARRYLSEYSADSVIASIAVAVAIGVSSDAVKAAAKAIAATARARARSVLGRSDGVAATDDALITVKIAELELRQPGVTLRGVEITGRVSEIERLTGEALSRRAPQVPTSEANPVTQSLSATDAE
ncbi:hypothetical protein ACGFW5_11410 [Streptomyces sp. NPDC048416]|uniref:hypothetical protein n=1 Tax=Streptomyces sp. NPDC048416 TaxID=3365546 RepID=UPI0037156DF5